MPEREPTLDRRILALAVPALGALVAEPLFVLVDSAMVGHLGTAELAGLTLASTLLITAVGLFVFLAYATTASVGRLLGAGQERRALASGIDGMWLALAVGLAVAALGILLAPWAIGALGGTGEVHTHGVTYLRTSLPGLPGMLVVLAATGVLRGMLDTRTPLVVAGVGAVANAALNALFIYGFGWGIGGSGAGTAIVQIAMALVLARVVVRGARARGVPLAPSLGGLGQGLRDGAPLFLRTLTLRIAVLLTVATAATLGDVPLAAHQIVNSLWGFAAFALDALAIAAQALVGRSLGASDRASARAVLRRTLQWGAGAGAALGVVLAALAVPLAAAFTPDGDVRRAATAGILVIAVAMPLAGLVFVLDGVLIGAGDGPFLAWAGVVSLVAYLPFVAAVQQLAPRGGSAAVVWLWVAFGVVFMLARGAATGLRSRGERWLVLGAR
ncbi:MATE family efflux transporter [Litorihabitans aurantiacus]|uniref:MATE family efflux transporter n=1 Tax=Litorihabitans aurantiacus TaxID=1930061 RepID=A0AA38CWF0_9MICO|nr:MATE family efflux transporter [Litorihabitans aurantiacus]GMA33057.1 MATE family efflux transporter [Litorihabitans aurantiacus]